MLIHAALSCSIACAPGQCIHLHDNTRNGMHEGPYTQLAFPYADSYIDHGMCAAFAGVRFRGCRLLFRAMRCCEAPVGTGEHIAHHARMPCPRAHAFAHPHTSLMRALRFCALPTLPACVICGAHAVCVCCAQACDVVQARVQGGGVGVWGAVGEGWVGQGCLFACENAADIDAYSQIR